MAALAMKHGRVGPAGCSGCSALLAAISVVSLAAQDAGSYRDAKAKDLFNNGRIAITGGPNGLSRLRSMRLKGRSKIEAANGVMVDAAVEIRIQLPDHYLRIDSGSFGRRQTGYAGSTLLNLVESGGTRTLADPKDASILEADKAELARFMLGVATYVSEEVPLKLQTTDTPVEMPGKADPMGVDAVGDRGFTARIVFDARTRLPVRLVYWGTGRTPFTMEFLDRKSVGGFRLPYRIVTTGAERTVDELTFDEIVVNPSFSKTDFAR